MYIIYNIYITYITYTIYIIYRCISPTRLLQCHLHRSCCTAIITQELLHRSCYTRVVTQHFFHRSCYTGVVRLELLQRSCLTGVTHELLHMSYYRGVVTQELPDWSSRVCYTRVDLQVIIFYLNSNKTPVCPFQFPLRSGWCCAWHRLAVSYDFAAKNVVKKWSL